MIAVLFKSWVARKTNNASTPTVTTSSANVKPAIRLVAACALLSALMVDRVALNAMISSSSEKLIHLCA
jgi:hypothetical protein